jgi:hypothetical protein
MNQACDLSILVMNLDNINDPSYGCGGSADIYKRRKSYWLHTSGNEYEKEEKLKKDKKLKEDKRKKKIESLKISLHELNEEYEKLKANDPDCDLLAKIQTQLQEDLKYEEQQTKAVLQKIKV